MSTNESNSKELHSGMGYNNDSVSGRVTSSEEMIKDSKPSA